MRTYKILYGHNIVKQWLEIDKQWYNLFEERVAAYISIEMYKLSDNRDNDSSILNAAYLYQ